LTGVAQFPKFTSKGIDLGLEILLDVADIVDDLGSLIDKVPIGIYDVCNLLLSKRLAKAPVGVD
jgi:hypothetical protein